MFKMAWVSGSRARLMPSPRRIYAELRRVPEPCGLLMREPIDICEMGLVDEVSCEAGVVRIVLVLTDMSCVHFAGLRRYIADVVSTLPGVDAVEVVASKTKMWTPDRRRPRRGSGPSDGG